MNVPMKKLINSQTELPEKMDKLADKNNNFVASKEFGGAKYMSHFILNVASRQNNFDNFVSSIIKII